MEMKSKDTNRASTHNKKLFKRWKSQKIIKPCVKEIDSESRPYYSSHRKLKGSHEDQLIKKEKLKTKLRNCKRGVSYQQHKITRNSSLKNSLKIIKGLRSKLKSPLDLPLLLQKVVLQKKIHMFFAAGKHKMETTLDFYQFNKLLGEGSFGKVYSAYNILTEKKVAIKCFDKSKLKGTNDKTKIAQEVKILRMMDHPNVTRLLEVFENQKYIFFVLSYASEGDILQLLRKQGPLKEAFAKFLTVQIINGLSYCHKKRVLHRDIKLDNVLLDKNYIAKICDFGVSTILKQGQVLKEQCGTPAYIAPEVIKGKGYSSLQPDVWNLGILLFAMVTGTVPFKCDSIEELHKLILKGIYSFPKKSSISENLKNLIKRMLILDPKQRITLTEMLEHPWIKKDSELIILGKETLKTVRKKKVFQKLVEFGFPLEIIVKSLKNREINHVNACYQLLKIIK